ncbi:ferritin-like domain-containing protein [Sphingopyxis sp. PAMC25046]|uniref:ferritin-like domain-containing protein n=1 Tax=Sphingopyxis sp. PAMC25046 TaxID=2565556 RepID=UPI001444CD23|nr:ferritin-like domain-containing protein [Sphingopyxis sp. PAMC25046]
MPQIDALNSVSREKLLHALYEAAELEQNLMCTYLYAAFSLRDGEAEGLNRAETEAVARWRRVILDVAIDEMSHLVTVWNITAALGGAPRFGRTNFPLAPGYLPGGISVKLAPFGPAVLQHFIFLERPEESGEPDGNGFAAENGSTRTPVAPRLTPAAFDYATIGSFYQAIESGLRALVAKHGEAAVFCGDPALQLSSDETNLAGATPIASLDAALAALAEIVVEGEGAPSDRANSHFQRFLGVREELRALLTANPGFAPAHPAAVNPVLRKPPEAAGRVWLKDADAVAAVDLANAIYALSLRLLAGAYALPSPSPEKALYVGCAIGLMHALAAIAERAARLPAGPSNPHCNAGVSFTALREAAALPQGASARHLYRERVEELSAVAAALDPADPRCSRAARILEKQADRLRAAPAPVSERQEPASRTCDQAVLSAGPVQPGAKDPADGHDVTVHFDGTRCIHARVCVTQAPATFLADVEGPWIIADATDTEQLCGIIRQCPSGALSYERRGGAPEPVPPANLVTLRENGPYAVRADLLLAGECVGHRATLCRCGASKNKPYCDKSHDHVGFVATGEPLSLDTPKLADRGGVLAIEPEDDGPLHVTGNLQILSGTGRAIACVRKTRLCRCGGSSNKPFCDGTHRRIGFRT